MTDCQVCQLIQAKSLTIFEDEHVVAFVHPEPSVPGQIAVAPKPHSPIFETIPDVIVKQMFTVANKLSIGVFEAVGAQGTNLLIQNGLPAGQAKPHSLISIIPRRDGDSLNLEWQPGKVSEDDSKKAESALKDAAQNIGKVEKEKPKPLEEKKPEKMDIQDSDYRMKQLRRIP